MMESKMREYPEEPLVEQLVTYTLEWDGRKYVFHDVPARVNLDTGEQLFAPATVEWLQRMIWEARDNDGG